jgi:hypothetical protein
LKNAQIYIGDGATLTHSFIRKRDERLSGHDQCANRLVRERGRAASHHHALRVEIVTGDEMELVL